MKVIRYFYKGYYTVKMTDEERSQLMDMLAAAGGLLRHYECEDSANDIANILKTLIDYKSDYRL